MTKQSNLPQLPKTDWLLHMPAGYYEPEWTSSQSGYEEGHMLEYGQLCRQQAFEEAAKLCEATAELCLSLQNVKDSDNLSDVFFRHHAVAHRNDAEAIRNMK